MRKSLGWLAVPVTVIVALFGIFGRDPAIRYSAAWSIDAAASSILVVWPIIAGVGAMDSVRLARSGALSLIEAMPSGAAWRCRVDRALWIGVLGLLGLLIAVGIGVGVSLAHGSVLTPSAFLPLAPAALGTFAAALAGVAVGKINPSWVVPPLMVAGTFGAAAFDILRARSLMSFVGATSWTMVTSDLHPTVVLVGSLYIVAACALCILVLWKGRRNSLLHAAGTMMSLVCVIGLWLAVVSADSRGIVVEQDPSAWPCAPVHSESTVCVPKDQERDLPLLARELAPIDSRVRDIDPEAPPVRYAPARAGRDTAVIPLPFGVDVDHGDLSYAMASFLGYCFDARLDQVTDDDEMESLLVAHETLARWVDPAYVPDAFTLSSLGIPREPPTKEEAGRAMSVLRECPS